MDKNCKFITTIKHSYASSVQIMQLPLLKNYFKDDNTTPIPTINHIEQYDSANQGNCITRHAHFKSKIAKLRKKKTFQNAT